MKHLETNENIPFKVNKILLSRNHLSNPTLTPKNRTKNLIPSRIYFQDANLKTEAICFNKYRPSTDSEENKRCQYEYFGNGTSKGKHFKDDGNPELQGYKIKASRSPKGIKDILNKINNLREEEREIGGKGDNAC